MILSTFAASANLARVWLGEHDPNRETFDGASEKLQNRVRGGCMMASHRVTSILEV